MIIDFHTHVFPEKIAKSTISTLSQSAQIPAHYNGTKDGLLRSMEISGVDISVVLPVMTSPKQFESVNKFAKELNDEFEKTGKGLLSFGGIHPKCED
ncbi:MAG: metal-dependent hydrolase, partial [Clostridia bacterium]|nr:metal-dependent hydrolase [Clostridia bacterium]